MSPTVEREFMFSQPGETRAGRHESTLALSDEGFRAHIHGRILGNVPV